MLITTRRAVSGVGWQGIWCCAPSYASRDGPTSDLIFYKWDQPTRGRLSIHAKAADNGRDYMNAGHTWRAALPLPAHPSHIVFQNLWVLAKLWRQQLCCQEFDNWKECILSRMLNIQWESILLFFGIIIHNTNIILILHDKYNSRIYWTN